MGIRGRSSTAELAIASPLTVVERPRPPEALSDAQAELWVGIVNRMPSEWFSTENLPLLEAYCQCVDMHRTITHQLNVFEAKWLTDEDGLRRFARLTEIQGRQAKLMKDLATSMRLTQQSRYRADKASTLERQGRGIKPWQREGTATPTGSKGSVAYLKAS
jgi:hypothetical protein